MKDYDSILAKARKLAALAGDTAATDGERDNAQRMLEAHCLRYGITAERLAVSARRQRQLECIVPGRSFKPVRSMDLLYLACQCLWFVIGEKRDVFKSSDEVFRTVKKKRGLAEEKGFQIYVAKAQVTDLEFDEWRACFHHYAADFWLSVEDLKVQAKIAAKAVKMALSGFVHRHGIFPPSTKDEKEEPLSPEKLAALIAAMNAARGEGFVRGRGKLEQGGLLL